MIAGETTGVSNGMLTYMPKSTIADVQTGFASAMEKHGLHLHRSYLTALSGGADSSALALLTQQYANATGRRHHAVIIDHGLREHSYNEACRVRDRMRSYGVTSDIISIDGPRPKSGLQEWARMQRHRLLMSVARDRQAVLLFAHHADDQAETIAMRLLKGSGITGLAGMPSKRTQHGVIISRPLLGCSHDQLSLVCDYFDCAFEDDPSNTDRQFERVRIRQLLASLDQNGEGPSSNQLLRLGLLSAKLSTTALDANARPLGKAVEWHSAGYATMVMKYLVDLPKFRWTQIMRSLVMAISGSAYAPSGAALDELRTRVDTGRSATIGGCHFSPVQTVQDRARSYANKSFVYSLFRETGRHQRAIPIGAGEEVVFAGCWLVKSQQAGMLQAFGDAVRLADVVDASIIRENMPEDWHLIPRRARQAIPVLTALDGCLIYPQILGVTKKQPATPVAAQYLGLAENPVFHANTPFSVPC